jgi:dTDP-4-dehydro-6-deoxy-alpha-D-glucopyranose 2,3-dehydratase
MINRERNKNIHLEFLKSALCKDGHYIKTTDVIEWIKKQNQAVKVRIKKIPFKNLKLWSFDDVNGNLKHDSGRFFSIDGIRIKTNWGKVTQWDQPIINQPEIGYLGFIAKEINGVLHFLVQAKIEPGNINYVQLSPTIQATRSNYEQAHKGQKPLYLEHFQNARSSQILLDQLQSEQGARFLRKRNRNIIIKVDEEVPICDNFTWLTLAQLKELMNYDNLVNMDSRTVISGIPFGDFSSEIVDVFSFIGNHSKLQRQFIHSALTTENELHSIGEIIAFLTQIKSVTDLDVRTIPLQNLGNWIISEKSISHEENKYFKIIAVDVKIDSREVINWSQPMVEPAQKGLCAFVCKEINGVLHFAVQAKLESGNYDIVEFAPTVQTLTDDYRKTEKNLLPFLDYVLDVSEDKIYFDTLQSEEGGRFYKEQNRNMIIIAGEELNIELPPNYIWMTLHQMHLFLIFNNYLNIQARSLIAAISLV